MSDNSIQVAPTGADEAASAVPESGATAAPENEISQAPAGGEQPQEPSRVFTQEEMDAAIGKRLAKERRAWERQQQQAAEQPQPITIGEEPDPSDYETPLDYAKALGKYEAAIIVANREHQDREAKTNSSFRDRVEAARDKYEDFDSVAMNEDLLIPPTMGKIIKTSEVGTDILYHLGKNPREAERIAALDPLGQAVEIGKLAATIGTNPTLPAKKTTTAPAPITPLGSGAATPVLDPLDPRSLKSMSTSQWIAARNAQEAAKRQ